MKVKCIAPFFDLVEKVDRKVGDVWEVDEERFESVNSTEFGILVEKAAERKSRAKKAQEED